MQNTHSADIEPAAISGLLDASLTVTRDRHGQASILIKVGSPGSTPGECDSIELVLNSASADEIAELLRDDRPARHSTAVQCSIGVLRRR
ncbi:hypothetical protein [Micromonospora sp. SH-82]|uniref:hypothetical protein n=1 Tax=Micromonospora sp. SH-82 TaxID=3132938 RepID=UPI003EBD7317